jgi:thymidylate kinase
VKTSQTIMISGKQGTGKSTLANFLTNHFESHGWQIFPYKFARPLYEMHNACRHVLMKYGVRGYNFEKKDGVLLQILGTEWGRNTINPYIWVDCARNYISRNARMTTSALFLIDDLRFKDEFNLDEGAIKIRLECDREIRKVRCEAWRDNDMHQTEIDLDDWVDRFDLVLDTGKISKEDMFNKTLEFLAGVL